MGNLNLQIAEKIKHEDEEAKAIREQYVFIAILLVVVIGVIGYVTMMYRPTSSTTKDIEIVEVAPQSSSTNNVRLEAGAAEFF